MAEVLVPVPDESAEEVQTYTAPFGGKASLYGYSGRITGIGAAELITFGDDGQEFYDC